MFAGQQQKCWTSVPYLWHTDQKSYLALRISITKSLDRQLKVHALGRLQEGRHVGLFFLQEILNEKHTIILRVDQNSQLSILAIIHIQACRLICGEPVWSLSLCSGRTNHTLNCHLCNSLLSLQGSRDTEVLSLSWETSTSKSFSFSDSWRQCRLA